MQEKEVVDRNMEGLHLQKRHGDAITYYNLVSHDLLFGWNSQEGHVINKDIRQSKRHH